MRLLSLQHNQIKSITIHDAAGLPPRPPSGLHGDAFAAWQASDLLRPSLNGYESVVFLDLTGNELTSLAGIAGLFPKLKVLKVRSSEVRLSIRRVIWITRDPHTRPQVGMNQLSSAAGLEALTQLDVLDLHSNRLEGVDGIQGLVALRIANLGGNRIRKLPDLSALSGLTEINMRRNALTSLDGLLPAVSVERLFLSHNRLATVESLAPIRQAPFARQQQ